MKKGELFNGSKYLFHRADFVRQQSISPSTLTVFIGVLLIATRTYHWIYPCQHTRVVREGNGVKVLCYLRHHRSTQFRSVPNEYWCSRGSSVPSLARERTVG